MAFVKSAFDYLVFMTGFFERPIKGSKHRYTLSDVTCSLEIDVSFKTKK
jgi:hypothetical protein